MERQSKNRLKKKYFAALRHFKWKAALLYGYMYVQSWGPNHVMSISVDYVKSIFSGMFLI